MSVQTSAHEHGALHIYPIALFETVEISQTQRLLHSGNGVKVALHLHDRQAHSVMRYRLVNRQRFAKWIAKGEMFIRLLGLNLYDLSHGFYDS